MFLIDTTMWLFNPSRDNATIFLGSLFWWQPFHDEKCCHNVHHFQALESYPEHKHAVDRRIVRRMCSHCKGHFICPSSALLGGTNSWVPTSMILWFFMPSSFLLFHPHLDPVNWVRTSSTTWRVSHASSNSKMWLCLHDLLPCQSSCRYC